MQCDNFISECVQACFTVEWLAFACISEAEVRDEK
jgi:hypothetical protein